MRQKIILILNDEIIGNNKDFFSSLVAKWNIPKYEDL